MVSTPETNGERVSHAHVKIYGTKSNCFEMRRKSVENAFPFKFP